MGELTKRQTELLGSISDATYLDGSGNGLVMSDGVQAAVASRLEAKGLVTVPAWHGVIFGGFIGVRITPAGRAALRNHEASE